MSWVKKNNPWGSKSVYKTRDMNAWIDRVMLEYRKISHRIHKDAELSKEERHALLNTMGAFESSIAHYQAAVSLTNEQPLGVFTLVRQSLEDIINIAIDWHEYPIDGLPPNKHEMVEELLSDVQFKNSGEDGELPLNKHFVMRVFNYNLPSWPPSMAGESVYSFSAALEDIEEHPPVDFLGMVTRLPLAIKALANWKASWQSYWQVLPGQFELSSSKDHIGHWVYIELANEWDEMVGKLGEDVPSWVEAILPWSSHISSEEE
jgi:hypothetical protein